MNTGTDSSEYMQTQQPSRRQTLRGLETSAAQRRCHQLILSMHCIVALVQVMPLVSWWLTRQVSGRGHDLAVWGSMTLAIAAVQFGYLVALCGVIDWSALRIISWLSLMVGMLYAFLLAVVMLAPRGALMGMLELVDTSQWVVASVCLILVLIHGVLAWWAARDCSRWRAEVRRTWRR